ncbi:MAG TPA: tRNA pseudouridine(55) synthase TruB [Myxococcales bacterium]
MNGLLIIDKPEGLTSFDVVAVLRRTLKTKKAGHTGTLDPMATGVLPVCLGESTRLVPFIIDGDKTYEASVRLGASTDTQDRTGKVIAEAPVPQSLTREALEQALDRFRGEIDQAPPMYSAVRVDGKRLYELAREGKEVDRIARRVTVHELQVLDLSLPDLRMRVRCSKGTYIRTLAHDLGEVLGCHAHLTALRRTESTGFSIAQAVTLDELTRLNRDALASRILTPSQALAALPAVVVPDALVVRLTQGQRLPVAELNLAVGQDGERVRMLSTAGELLAVAEWRAGGLQYLRVLAGAPQPPAASGGGEKKSGGPGSGR